MLNEYISKINDLKFAPSPEYPIEYSVRIFVLACFDITRPQQISRISHAKLSGAYVQTDFGLVEVHYFYFIHEGKRSAKPDENTPWREQARSFFTQIIQWYNLHKRSA